jgi:hypothetical protein
LRHADPEPAPFLQLPTVCSCNPLALAANLPNRHDSTGFDGD